MGPEAESGLWQAFRTVAPARRRESEPSSERRKRRHAPSPPPRAEPQDGHEAAQAGHGRGLAQGPRHPRSATLDASRECAVKLGIARALLTFDEDLRKDLRAGGFLTRDPRVKERKKYGRKKARRGFQFVKR